MQYVSSLQNQKNGEKKMILFSNLQYYVHDQLLLDLNDSRLGAYAMVLWYTSNNPVCLCMCTCAYT